MITKPDKRPGMSEDDEKLIEAMARAICAENCAFRGEPPCFLIEDERGGLALEWPAPGCNEPSCTDLARAVLAAVRQAEGWRLVPVEPTEAMLNAARDWSARRYGQSIGNAAAADCYTVMLAAAHKSDD